MPTFEVFIDDDRYRVPTLYLIDAADEAAARARAADLLHESAHHLGVEVRLDGVRLHGQGTLAEEDGGGLGVAAG